MPAGRRSRCALAQPKESPGLDADAEAVLAVLLQCLADRRPMVLASRDAERAARAVRQVVEVLPEGLAGGLSLATFASDPAGGAAAARRHRAAVLPSEGRPISISTPVGDRRKDRRRPSSPR